MATCTRSSTTRSATSASIRHGNCLALSYPVSFTQEAKYMLKLTDVDQDEQLYHGGLQDKNTVSCDQCHPNAANTHPETYPKFQKQPGKVVSCWAK